VRLNGTLEADYDYDAVSNLTQTTFGNGTRENRSYDTLNRLSTLETKRLSDSVQLSKYVYTLDKVGNRTAVTEAQNGQGRTIGYTYDDLYRLTGEAIVDATNGNRTSAYVYDKVGNRQTKTVNGVTTVYTYDANDRLLNEKVGGVVTVAYTYDDNGSTLSKTENGVVTTYVWNDEKRLIQATVGGTVVDYRYNDAGIRVSSKQNGVETRYLLDEGMTANVWEEYGPSGAVQGSYSYGYDLITQTQAGQASYYLVDGLGSTRLLTDTQGQVLNSYGYEAFGETVSQSGTTGNKYQYAGEQLDGTLGDYYLRQRFYDTSSGRFGRRDEFLGEIETPMSLHKYIYADENPITGIDPTGYQTASMAEFSSIFSTLSSLASTVVGAAARPFVIETAKNWALLLAAGVASAYLLFRVFEKTKADGTADVKIYPDDAPDPDPPKKKKRYELNDTKYVNRMRLQVQGGGDFGIGLFNTSDVGVLVLQVAAATGEMLRRRSSSFTWLSGKHADGALIKATAFINEAAVHWQKKGGIREGGTQAATFQWNADNPAGTGKEAVSSFGPLARKRWKDYRVDLENNYGHNLRN
jgi:RHS repeat-associated protein